jgi:SAM-dependent methyltransferase
MRAAYLRRWLNRFRRWPLHPQWLLTTSGEDGDLRAALEPLRGTVADVGCSDRRLSAMLHEGCRYIGIDYPATAIGMYGTRPDVFSDARSLPFADGALDAVILKDVLEHVKGPDLALREISRVLCDGGGLILWIPFMYPIHDSPHDFQRFTEHGLTAYLGAMHFQIIDIKAVLSPVETASLMMALALADASEQMVSRRRWLIPVLPVLGLLILITNLFGKGMAWLPSTRFMPAFYRVAARRIPRAQAGESQ